jgi:selenocysteine-specific elongation factor
VYVIGTAGHVDHGKSALVRALSGIDPDRLQEEKDRGMTIDLGFAWMQLEMQVEDETQKVDVSIVDVPGHERFIKNMLAGVGGVDLAMLVIAADEGVMPQTREHLAILDLLGVDRGVVALTKSDLVDKDWLDLVEAEVEDLIGITTLKGAPIVRCSAVTREGLDDLRSVLASQLAATPQRSDRGRPRLPVDRVFTVAGFGTVVTGTLVDGSLTLGQEVEVVPAFESGALTTLRGRVRGLQMHRTKLERSLPGTRTAVNLSGVETESLKRGQVVTTPGWLRPSIAIDVRLKALESLSRPLRHNLRVSFHCFATEAPARLRLLEADQLLPGEEGWAQIRVLEPVAVVAGDRFIIRDANDTIAGGTVVATQALRHPRRRASVISALEQLSAGDPAERIYASLAGMGIVPLTALLKSHREGAEDLLERLVTEGRAVKLGDAYAAATDYARLKQTARQVIKDQQKARPLARGVAKEELRSRLALQARPFAQLLDAFTHDGFDDLGNLVSLTGWVPSLSASQRAIADAYIASLETAPYAPPLGSRPEAELVAYLNDTGEVVDVSDGVVFTADAYREMVDAVVALLRERGTVTMAEVRDLLGSSRRYVQALLEHMDSDRITVRRGDARVLR